MVVYDVFGVYGEFYPIDDGEDYRYANAADEAGLVVAALGVKEKGTRRLFEGLSIFVEIGYYFYAMRVLVGDGIGMCGFRFIRPMKSLLETAFERVRTFELVSVDVRSADD